MLTEIAQNRIIQDFDVLDVKSLDKTVNEEADEI